MATRTKPTKKPAQKKLTINDLAIMVQNGFASLHTEMETRLSGIENKIDSLQGVVINEHGNRLNAVESDVLKIKVALQNK